MSLLGNINWDQVTATANSIAADGGDGTAGELTEAGLNTALGAVPFVGGFLTVIAGKLKIAENVGKVLKYGLSSWGASTTPEKTQGLFAENVYPYLVECQKAFTPELMGEQLTAMHAEFSMQLEYFKHKRRDHSKAKSTKLANDWAILEYAKIVQSFEDLANALRSKGVNITVTSYSANPDQFKFGDITDLDGVINDSDVNKSPVSLKKYVIDADSVRNLKVDPETGEVDKKTSMGTILTLAGLAFAAFKK